MAENDQSQASSNNPTRLNTTIDIFEEARDDYDLEDCTPVVFRSHSGQLFRAIGCSYLQSDEAVDDEDGEVPAEYEPEILYIELIPMDNRPAVVVFGSVADGIGDKVYGPLGVDEACQFAATRVAVAGQATILLLVPPSECEIPSETPTAPQQQGDTADEAGNAQTGSPATRPKNEGAV